ncbi:hypothetical protein GCM10007385_45130 [Tateyamaria omphalii]|uniref:DMT family transporter n=1 Tax=Tateyamaria omphalii TaxID=299262 RepID=UPI0016774031|nr:DMT family transporter [Tateyamaria omphalii]GGX71100.1 hypothetical protein GCM10007385_45130 [Tateyamaria omphalii]
MTSGQLRGLIWALSFVLLEAVQAVFFGGVFQSYDSFLVGAAVFGTTAFGTLLWANVFTPSQLQIAWANSSSLLGLNLSTAVVWVSYFYALQLIEPTVAFTIFSGLIPATIVVASIMRVPEASGLRNKVEALGLAIVVAGVVYLAAITLLGRSGFVRGNTIAALIGVVLSVISAISLAFMMIYSQRLDRLGVAPFAQYGLRFPLYVLIALLAVAFGLDDKGGFEPIGLLFIVLVGVAVIAFPVFAMQKAISLMPSLSLAAVTALGPLFVFFLQLMEGRVAYASATMTGLAVYFVGAVLAAYGGNAPSRAGKRKS